MIKNKFNGKIHTNKNETNNQSYISPLTFHYTIYKQSSKNNTEKKSKSKTGLWSFLFFLANLLVVGIILVIQLNSEEGLSSLHEVFKYNLKFRYLFIGLACFFLANIISSVKLDIHHHLLEKKYKPIVTFKSQMLSKYYTRITPFGVGGKAYQVYYLNRYGIKTSNALTMVSCTYVSNKLVYGILAILMVATFRWNKLLMSQGAAVNIVIIFAIISCSVLAIFLTFVILLFVNKKLGNKIIVLLVKLLTKLRIIKKPYALYLKIMRPALVFQHKMKDFFSSKKITFTFLFMSIFEYLIEYSIPFFVYSAFNGFNLSLYWQLLSISIIIELASHVIPMPGGTGMAEISFYAIFASLFHADVLFWALIIWRILSYYDYLIIGLGITTYDYIYGKKKFKSHLNDTPKKYKKQN